MGIFIRAIFGLFAFFSFFSIFIKIIFVKSMKFFLRKGYAEVAIIMTDRLCMNETFLDFAVENVRGQKKVTFKIVAHIFCACKEVEAMAREELQKRREAFKAKGDVTMLIWEDIVSTLADQFYDEWRNPATTNKIVLKVRTRLQ